MDDVWYVQINGKARACTPEQIEGLITNGMIDSSAQVWSEGASQWLPYCDSTIAKSVNAVKAVPSAPASIEQPPMPTMQVADDGWQDIRPAPWRRYFARMFDVMVLGLIAWVSLGFLIAYTSPALYQAIFTPEVIDNVLISALLTVLLVFPITTLLLGATGSSLGKWIFGVRVTKLDGSPIGFSAAMQREGAVYLRGMALGIPLVSLFTLVSAYRHLTTQGRTSWDASEPWVVTHRPVGLVQILLYFIGVIALLGVFAVIQAMKK